MQQDTEIRGLKDSADMIRDTWGVPHLRTTSPHDAFFLQGYVHARDRLWQMDSARRQMSGRWSEWVGSAGVPADTLARRLGGASASQRDYKAISDEARAMVDAYSAGVNAGIASLDRLPFEYGSLGVDEIEAWEGWHSIAAMRHRGFLMGSVWFKLWRAAALSVLPAEQVAKLRYDDGGEDRLSIPPGADGQRYIASVKDLAPAIAALSALRPTDEQGGGSNNWVLSGNRTSTSMPLIAGDPHRAFELPGMYAQMHLACPEFDVIGLTVPGVPGFPHFAHNAQVAWCVTHTFADIHDLYVERFDTAQPERYEFEGATYGADISRETIEVRDGDDVGIEIVRTRHGAIVAGDRHDGHALALKSVQVYDTDLSFDSLLPMLRAGTVDEFYDSTRGWGLIDHNLVAADRSGTIGHLVRALVPRRPVLNGWLPVPGWTGEYEWDGMIPFEEMPRVTNPERGFLVTANNRVVDRIPETGDHFCTDAHPPHRAARIEQLVSELDHATVADMATIHRDTLSFPAQLFIDRIAALTIDDAALARTQRIIAGWDARLEPDSVAATMYSRLRWRLAELVTERSGLGSLASDEWLTSMPPGVVAVNQVWWMLPTLLRNDDTSFLDGKQWDDMLTLALRETADQPEKPWSDVHTARLVHPLSAALPQTAATLNPEGAPLGGDNETAWANGSVHAAGLRAAYGAISRYAMDTSDWDASQWVVVDGVSGDPDSPHYNDQHAVWAQCAMIPMSYSDAAVDAVTAERVVVTPARA